MNDDAFLFVTLAKFCYDFETLRSNTIAYSDNTHQRDLVRALASFCVAFAPDSYPVQISQCIDVVHDKFLLCFIALIDSFVRENPHIADSFSPLIPTLYKNLPPNRVHDAAAIMSDWASSGIFPKSVTGRILVALRPALVPLASAAAAARRKAAAAAIPPHLASCAPTFHADPCLFAFGGPLSAGLHAIDAAFGVGVGVRCGTCGRTLSHVQQQDHSSICAAAAAEESRVSNVEKQESRNSRMRIDNELIYYRSPYVTDVALVGDGGWASTMNANEVAQHIATQGDGGVARVEGHSHLDMNATVTAESIPMCSQCGGMFRTTRVEMPGFGTRYALLVRSLHAMSFPHPTSPLYDLLDVGDCLGTLQNCAPLAFPLHLNPNQVLSHSNCLLERSSR